MTLSECKKGKWHRIESLQMEEPIKRRLQVLGFGEGERVRIARISPLGKTFLLEGNGRILLKRYEAEKIVVS